MLMALGQGFIFEVGNTIYQTIKEDAEGRYAEINPVQGSTRHQALGRGVETQNLEGVFYPLAHGGLAKLYAFKALVGTPIPLMMADGNGFIFGQWLVQSCSITKTHMTRGNIAQKVEFEVGLLLA